MRKRAEARPRSQICRKMPKRANLSPRRSSRRRIRLRSRKSPWTQPRSSSRSWTGCSGTRSRKRRRRSRAYRRFPRFRRALRPGARVSSRWRRRIWSVSQRILFLKAQMVSQPRNLFPERCCCAGVRASSGRSRRTRSTSGPGTGGQCISARRWSVWSTRRTRPSVGGSTTTIRAGRARTWRGAERHTAF